MFQMDTYVWVMCLVARWVREEVWKFDKNYLEMELKGCKLVCLKVCYICPKIYNCEDREFENLELIMWFLC